jgi:threonine dehydrogenase-like Zn-dependent dehydrogenase
VVVFGPGPLGAFSVALAAANGAEHVVIVGGTEERLAACRLLGATNTLNRRDTTPEARLEAVRDLTQGRGADLVVEAAGSVSAAQEGLAMLRAGGTLSLVGFGAPAGPWAWPPFEALARRNARIQGVWVSDARHTFQAMSLIRRQREAFAALVTHRFALPQATTALEAVASREAMKVVLLPGEAPGPRQAP